MIYNFFAISKFNVAIQLKFSFGAVKPQTSFYAQVFSTLLR